MIVKNEEKWLRRSLDSAKKLVDEITIVDTGSTDDTRNIAEEYGANIVDHTWNDDFSEARNVSIEAASTDWVIVLDADEELVADRHTIRKLLVNKSKNAYLVRVVVAPNKYSLDTATHRDNIFRLFRRSDEIRYKAPVHEYISMRSPDEWDQTDITIIHFGPTVEPEKDRTSRNLPLIEKGLAKEPNNPYIHYCLGNEHFGSQNYSAALHSYTQATSLGNAGQSFMHTALLRTVMCLFRLQRYQEALGLLHDLQMVFPDYTDLFFMEGEMAAELERLDVAKVLYSKCIQMGDAGLQYTSMAGVGSWRAKEALERISPG